ncbi:MAG: hypothetical protein GF331_20365 [Chitinivibrionales bacterium]|nr:hypothetical protein [Chitinivibrionales bacterium]
MAAIVNVFSYVLYDSAGEQVERDYDRHKDTCWRYWANIPALLVIIDHAFPRHAMRLHVDPASSKHPLFEFVQTLSNRHPRLEVRTVHRDGSKELPMFWRMLPLWDPAVRLCHPRDIDSLPTLEELRAVRYFEEHERFLVQGMRSHPNHNGPSCRILGGLCGFRADELRRRRRIPQTFDEFVALAQGAKWGDDLRLLRQHFVDRRSFLFRRRVLDTLLTAQVHPYRRKRTATLSLDELREVDLPQVSAEAQDLLRRLSAWAGEPVRATGQALEETLDLGGAAAEAIRASIADFPAAREYYGL